MLYLVGAEFEKKSGNIKNCWRWSDILCEMFPEIEILTNELCILQNISPIRVLQTLVGKRIWGCSELDARSLRKVLIWFDISKFKRSMLKSPRRTIFLLASLNKLSKKELKSDSHLPKKFLFICFNESPLKMMKNAFYFILKAPFVFKIFKVLSWHFGHVEEMA